MQWNVIRQIRAVVLKEELDCWEHRKEPTLERGQPWVDYVNKWLIDHQMQLNNSLGMEDCPEVKFLTGILIATSTSKAQAPILQDVIQADPTHVTREIHIVLSLCGFSQRECGWFGFWDSFGE